MEWTLLIVVALAMIPIGIIGTILSYLIREVAWRIATLFMLLSDELKDERR